MKKNKTLPKVVMAVSVVAMGTGLFQTLDVEAQTSGGPVNCYRYHGGGFNEATVDLCDNVTIVYSNEMPGGGCSGASNGCVGYYWH